MKDTLKRMPLAALLFAFFTTVVDAFVPDMVVYRVTDRMGYVQQADGSSIPNGGSLNNPIIYPIQHAIRTAGDQYGRKIRITAGDYEGRFEFNSTCNVYNYHCVAHIDSNAQNPVILKGDDGVVLKRRPGSGTNIAVGHGYSGGVNHADYIEWHNMEVQPGYETAVIIGSSADVQSGVKYTGWKFKNVRISGGWNYATGTSSYADPSTGDSGSTKWGMQLYSIGDFVVENSYIGDIRLEHAIYIHNASGDVTFKGSTFARTGRTSMQIMARKDDSQHCNGPCTNQPSNRDNIFIVNNNFIDYGLSDTNVSGITIVGRNGVDQQGNITGRVVINRNRFSVGLDDEIRAAVFANNNTWKAGSITTWTTNKEAFEPSGRAIIKNNSFNVGPGLNGMTMSISAMKATRIFNNVVDSGPNQHAIRLGREGDEPGSGCWNCHPVPEDYCVSRNNLIDGGKLRILSRFDDTSQPAYAPGSTLTCP